MTHRAAARGWVRKVLQASSRSASQEPFTAHYSPDACVRQAPVQNAPMELPVPRVALLVPEYHTDPEAMGGVTTVADFLYDDVVKAGWSVTRFTARTSRRALESRRLMAPRTWFKRLYLNHRADGVVAVGAHLAEFEPVRNLPRRVLDRHLQPFDVVLVVSGSPAFSLIASRCGKPVVTVVATMVKAERKRLIESSSVYRRVYQGLTLRIVDAQDRRGLRLASVVVTLNRWMQTESVAAGAQRVVLAPPGVDTEFFSPPDEYATAGPLVMVARLADPRKDYPTLFRAYAHARALGLTSTLVIAGRGALGEPDAEVLRQLHLQDSVEVRADLSSDDLLELLRSAALFVTSSSEEGLGLSTVEAMACGVPVVSTATEGAKFILEQCEGGELLPIGDARALGEAMVTWMASPVRRVGASLAARERAVAGFSLAATGAEFRRIISSAKISCAPTDPR